MIERLEDFNLPEVVDITFGFLSSTGSLIDFLTTGFSAFLVARSLNP
ncbi:MAG: hypothetical protein ACJA0U_003370 [Salibacteraceae bacterium]